MNIYVCVKQVPDTESKITLKESQKEIDTSSIKWILSPYDEMAVEEALRFKEQLIKNGGTATIHIVSAGPARAKDAIQAALAMGADEGHRIELPENAESTVTAKALTSFLKKAGNVDYLLAGKEAIDTNNGIVPILIAEALNLPCVTIVSGTEYSEKSVKCKRDLDKGMTEIIEVSFPCVLTATKGLNTPRYASLPNIMKARKKEIKVSTLEELGAAPTSPIMNTISIALPAPKKPGRKLSGELKDQAVELVKLLRTEAKVL